MEEDHIEKMVESLVERVRRCLPDISRMTEGELAAVLLTYQQLIQPNFVPLMAAVWVRCQSAEARDGCQENLSCEVREDHPRMLREFASQANTHLTPPMRFQVASAVRAGQALIGELYSHCRQDSIEGLLVMLSLEAASSEFIPWLAAAARRLSAQNLTYTDKHGVADEKHALDLLQAVRSEAETREPNQASIDREPSWKVFLLLHHIFHAHETT